MKRDISFYCFLEIFLLVMLSFSSTHIVAEQSSDAFEQGLFFGRAPFLEKVFAFYGKAVTNLLGDGIVSAQTTSPVSTCLETINGSYCQEFLSNSCDEKCSETCIPTNRDNVGECKIGTCYDKFEGTCQAGSPKALCENNQGEWFNDPFENIPQCREGCCVLGDNVAFTTERQCSRMASTIGINKDYRPEIRTEISCLALARTQEEGACVLTPESAGEANRCQFTTKQKCLTMQGEFNKGKLCSANELNTICEKQAVSKCVEGVDEIYWFDSCGNKENIYDANKAKSWNNGLVLSKNDSCSIGSIENPLRSQSTCGNCNYLFGSRCGVKTGSEKLADNSQEFVCRDLRCKEDSGVVHENGESWCVYQGSIGVDKGRSTDTPGSKHFKKVCIDGTIRTEPCAEFRNGICIENQLNISSSLKITSAACVMNAWQDCLAYNTKERTKSDDPETAQKNLADNCNSNSACFVNKVRISDDFHFNFCAPKFAPGFDLKANPDGAKALCKMASTTCTAVKVKKTSGWDWVANEECTEEVFAQEMNNLCMSLGDCGTSVNYAGDLTKNIRVRESPQLSTTYLAGLKKYSEIVKNKFASSDDVKSVGLGFPSDAGSEEFTGEAEEFIASLSMISGGIGTVIYGLSWLAGQSATFASIINANGWLTSVNTAVVYEGSSATVTGSVGLSSYASAALGAVAAVAVVALLLQYTGVGAGLSKAEAFLLLGAAAVGGALAASGSGAFWGGVAVPVIGWIILIVVILIIAILKIMGVGKVKKIYVSFSCKPWQAPVGGAKCAECGKDGLPCSRYACSSLGQRCEFINAGTGNEMCIDVAPDDVAPPIISPNRDVVLPGQSYEEVAGGNGFLVKGNESDQCIKAFDPVQIGIKLNEPGQCRYALVHTDTFEDMEEDFADDNLFLINHTARFRVPSLGALGVSGIDPERRGEFKWYVRCQDTSGNFNQNEYSIGFCVKPEEDVTPPIITGREPAEITAYNTVNVTASVFVNEPAECKWSSEDKSYVDMENEFLCHSGLNQEEFLGWRCTAPLEVRNESKYYVRCLDQPWLSEQSETGEPGETVGDETKRNAMTKSYLLTFKKTQTPLKITSLTPNNVTIISGVEPVSVTVEARTEGGIDGTAECKYVINNQEITFYETFARNHKQVFQSFTAGAKTLPVKCVDEIGNEANKTINFNIEIDRTAPQITRIYRQGETLNIITNEPGTCMYSKSSCNFVDNSTEASLMSGTEFTHTTGLESGATYYVRCADRFGNTVGGCSAIIRRN